MKKALLILALLFAMICFFLPRFFILHSQKEEISKAAAKSPPLAVKTLKMKPMIEPIEIILPSYLDAIHVTPIWARVNGYLREFLVDIGDKVSAGQLLAIIDAPDIDGELTRAEGELASMFAKREIAQITADRWVALYEHNPESLSREEVDIKVADYETAVANELAAKGNLDYWKALSSFKKIYAPFDGVITSRTVDIGSLIAAGGENNPQEFFMYPQKQELFQMARTDTLRAFADVPQSLFYLVEDGLKVEAAIWQYPGKVYEGTIERNSGSLSPRARTLLTQVNIQNESQELMPGLYAQLKFHFIPKQKTFTIPVGALIIRDGPPYVALVKKNTVHLQEVKIGVDGGKVVQIIEGIQLNDRVIINPTDRVSEGVLVNPVPVTEEEERMLLGKPPEVQGDDAIMG